jgi:hypothetical protein
MRMIQRNPVRSRTGIRHRILVLAVAAVVAVVTMTGVRQPDAAAAAVSYAMIGDSITWQATADLAAAIPGIRVDGVIGRSFGQVGDAYDLMMAGGSPDVLIIALGTNPPMTLSQVDAFMKKAGVIERIFFVNIRIPRDWESRINSMINSLPQRYENVSVIDWYGFSGERPEVFNTSGFHLSDQGKPIYAEFIAASVFSQTEECLPPTQTEPGSAGVGTVDPQSGIWYLRDPLTGDTTSFYYGNPGDRPFMGDWNGDGIDTPGLYRRSDGYAYLRYSNTQGVAEVAFLFGNPGDLPVPGDFDGDGFDTLSLYRPSENRFYIINELGSDGLGLGAADYWIDFGDTGDQPFSGDFDGDGTDTVGIHRPVSGLVAISASPKASFYFGASNDKLVTGAFDGGSEETIGVFRSTNASFYLRSTLASGPVDHSFRYGLSRHNPIVGFFGDLPGGSTPPHPAFCTQP